MQNKLMTRRTFFASSALGGSCLAGLTPVKSSSGREKPRHKVERLGVGAIGMRYQGSVIADKARQYADIVAIADVDRHVREQARANFGGGARIYEDYRDLLTRHDVDVITIGAPDHWHVKMAIDACLAGKDVYVEKPLTLTIDEGKQLRRVVQETGRVLQVGSWQRSDHRFRLAAEMVRQGKIGKLQQVDVVLGKNKTGGPFQQRKPPEHLNWDMWQGQTLNVPYIEERCHYTFRWWLEYSGGQMTDWGAHHLDIAQWGIGAYPTEIDGRAKFPSVHNAYNVPIDFHVTYKYPDGVVMTVSDEGRNGVLFTGTKGRIFVNRGTIAGKPIEDASSVLTREEFTLYNHDNLGRPERAGKLAAIINHMGNFFDCVQSRKTPISDVESQHRSTSTCHLANISMRLGRSLTWDSAVEQFVGDSEADRMIFRKQRGGYEIT